MRGPETNLRKKIQKKLRSRWPKAIIWKIHGGPMQNVGIPDLVCCFSGVFFGLEVKLPKKSSKPTAMQLIVLQQIEDAMGYSAIVRSPEDAIAAVEKGLKHFRERVLKAIKKPRAVKL